METEYAPKHAKAKPADLEDTAAGTAPARPEGHGSDAGRHAAPEEED